LKLYHFTGLRALIGEAGLAVIQPGEVNLMTIAAPGSIMSAGLKPYREDGYDGVLRSPLPPCVWLTSDPDMDLQAIMGFHFSKYADFRVNVLIPSTDRRLTHWPQYFRKHGQCTLSEAMRKADLPEGARRTTTTFYAYFGKIKRITAVSRVETTPAAPPHFSEE
jgi:hypothetical protein